MRTMLLRWLSTSVLLLALGVARGEDASLKEYNDGDLVPLIANKVGPFANPTETYMYYSLPFCAPDELEHQKHELGEILAGDRKVKTPYKIGFREDVEERELCTKHLTEQVSSMRRASLRCQVDGSCRCDTWALIA